MLAWDAGRPGTFAGDRVAGQAPGGPARGHLAGGAERSGLPGDPYFSAGKLAWLLDEGPAVATARGAGRLRLGTVDAFLVTGWAAASPPTSRRPRAPSCWRSADGTGTSGCSRHFGLERELLPAVGPTFGELGELRSERWPGPLALRAQLVDQQAALAGSGAVSPGEAKATYGTGVFVLGRTAGQDPCAGLLPTVAWAGRAGRGAAVRWPMRSTAASSRPGRCSSGWPASLGLAARRAIAGGAGGPGAGQRRRQAAAGPGGARLAVVEARRPGVIAGLHGGIEPAHIARAALEGIAQRVADIVEAMASAVPISAPARRRRPDERPDAGGIAGGPAGACADGRAAPTQRCSGRRCLPASGRASTGASRRRPSWLDRPDDQPRLGEGERLAARRGLAGFVAPPGRSEGYPDAGLVAALGQRRKNLLGVLAPARLERQLDAGLAHMQGDGLAQVLDADHVGARARPPGRAARPGRPGGRGRG